MSRRAPATTVVASLVLFGVFAAASPAHADATVTGALTAEYFLNTSREASALDARLELYRVPVFRQAINNALQAANNEVVLGEAVAASD